MKLYTYWRSLATLRVRIAMNIKGIAVEPIIVDLTAGHQMRPDYASVNPQMTVPALVDGDGPALFQSMAIIEYLEETHPQPPLLPRDPKGRARVRGLAQIAVSDAHPLIVPRVRNYMTDVLRVSEADRLRWIQHWMSTGLAAYEGILARDAATGRFCHGDAVTVADICMVSHVIGHLTFEGKLDDYPVTRTIYERCMAMTEFASAHPKRQPDAPKG